MFRSVDCLIVGAGFSGLTMAERLVTQQGKTCLVVEKRGHLGGNAYDHHDDHGVLIHAYGPHYFRTNSHKIVDYLGRFTDWHPVEYKILSCTDGRYWNFPINLNTFEQLLGRPSTTEEMEEWLAAHRVPIDHPANSEEVIVNQVGWELYEKFFKGYTLKQWRRHPKDLDASVCGRIPIRTGRDDRYLQEDFQALPKDGYTRMFGRMVAACGDRLEVLLNTDFRDILPHITFKHLVYTGPVDGFYDFEFGRLPYRSLRFEPESFTAEQLATRAAARREHGSAIHHPPSAFPVPAGHYQPAMQVNYPNSEDFTRIVEIKHATGQACRNTTIVREYPDDYGPGKEPYYPVPAADSAVIYRKYKERTETDPFPASLRSLVTRHSSQATSAPRVSFIGRLATYRYLNMDQVVAMALKEAEKIAAQTR